MGKGVTMQGKSAQPYEGAVGNQAPGTRNFGGAWQDLGNKGGGSVSNSAMSKKSAPPPPDYYGAATAQGQSGQQAVQTQTQANRPNINTGFGGETWSQDANGNWTLNAGLNSTLGGALTGLQGQAANNARNGPQDIQAARDSAISSNYGQATSRLDPQWAQRDEAVRNQLINQGLDPSSQAYQQAQHQEDLARNDAYSSAMANAIGLGNQTESEQLAAQLAPYQQMAYLMGFQNGMPGFNAAGAWQPTPYLSAADAMGGYGLQATSINDQKQADVMQGVGELGQAMSDERVKTDVKRLDVDAIPGVPLATWKWKHAPERGHQLGVIAQDVEKVLPGAVAEGPDGIKRVNYAALVPFSLK